MELVAQESGLTRQALYHHFASKEALFRAVVEAVYEGAFEAERAAGLRQEQAGKGLADILAAQLEARFRYLFDRIKGSAQVEELLSEQQRQTRDLHQSFIDRKLSLIAGAIERARAAGKVALRDGVTPVGLARSRRACGARARSQKGRRERARRPRTIRSPDGRRSDRRGARNSRAAPLKETAMTSALINGRAATLPDDPEALLVDVLRDQLAPDRNQARLRRRRLRRLHGPARRGSGRELPPAGESGRGQERDHGRGRRRRQIACRAARLHGPRRAAMRVLHPGLHRRGERLPRRLARRARRRDPVARGDRPRALRPPLPLRRL